MPILSGETYARLMTSIDPRTPVIVGVRQRSYRDGDNEPIAMMTDTAEAALAEMWAEVRLEISEGRQAYVVCPLIDESEKMEVASAELIYARLADEELEGLRIGLLHGRMPADEKDAAMDAFRRGDLDVLVATTVIEVGIDVPNASVMLIEHAERFGLSQLHQLRGRVGRGAAESHCILIAEPGEDALERLRVFRDTTDGFEVARADLRIRGQGDLFGSQQHGRDPALRFADLLADEDLLVEAQREARAIVAMDPELERPDHARIRDHLHARYQHRLAMYGVG